VKAKIILLFLLCASISTLDAANDILPKLQFNFSVGASYLTVQSAVNPSNENFVNLTKYIDKLHNEFNSQFDILYFPQNNIGYGLKYNLYSYSAQGQDFIFNSDDGIHNIVGDMAEKDFVNFIGPTIMFVTNSSPENPLKFFVQYSVGYVSYRSETTMAETNILLTGESFGTSMDAGLHYCLTKNLSFGLKASLLYSTVSNIEIFDGLNKESKTLDKYNSINNSSVGLSASISYIFSHKK